MKGQPPIITSRALRQRMNALGRARVPFLWATDYECSRGFVLENPEEADAAIRWSVRGRGNGHSAAARGCPPPSLKIVSEIGHEAYQHMFGTVMAGLMRGDSFLCNLTGRTRVECDGGLEAIFAHADAPYKLLIGDEFVCFSPEPFVRICGNRISTYPMKGTADASVPGAEEALLNDYKEMCEHHTIVDLMRNDLNSVASGVEVCKFRYVERIGTRKGTILQTSSEICGRLPQGKERDFGDIIFPMLPAGSITGAPKEATVEIIRRAETAPRGWYTGVFGYFDGDTMETAVMIRCIQRSADGSLYFHSGGGITVNSRCHEEYSELITKVYLTQ